MPSLKTIEEVTAAFGISMRQFFAEKGDPALFTPQQEAVFFLYHDTSIPQRKAILHAMELLSEQNGIAKTNYNEIEFQEEHNMDAIARIKELMEERGWTLYRLSQESGIAITTLITANSLLCRRSKSSVNPWRSPWRNFSPGRLSPADLLRNS